MDRTTSTRLNSQILLIKEYLCRATPDDGVIAAGLELEERPSSLPSRFLNGKHMGLFTKKQIPSGTIISAVVRDASKLNDAVINLEDIIGARTSVEMYQAWIKLKDSYYDLEKIKRLVNVRMVMDASGRMFYETIRDVSPDEELLRIYGFTTWFFEILDVYTNKTIMGFIRFVDEFLKDLEGDPFKERVIYLHKALNQYKSLYKYEGKSINDLSLEEYDEMMVNENVEYLGDVIKTFYLMG